MRTWALLGLSLLVSVDCVAGGCFGNGLLFNLDGVGANGVLFGQAPEGLVIFPQGKAPETYVFYDWNKKTWVQRLTVKKKSTDTPLEDGSTVSVQGWPLKLRVNGTHLGLIASNGTEVYTLALDYPDADNVQATGLFHIGSKLISEMRLYNTRGAQDTGGGHDLADIKLYDKSGQVVGKLADKGSGTGECSVKNPPVQTGWVTPNAADVGLDSGAPADPASGSQSGAGA